ncbi:MAG: hypothetical protein ACRCT6_03500, partial [Notoacmeibacter sp.]
LRAGLVEERLAAAAKQKALSGQRHEAVQISAAHQAVQQQRATAESYNLDRKLEMFNLLRKAHPYLVSG